MAKRIVWLRVTDDDLQLPVAVADSSKELAELCGTTQDAIISAVSHAKRRGNRSRYVKVYIEEDDNDINTG